MHRLAHINDSHSHIREDASSLSEVLLEGQQGHGEAWLGTRQQDRAQPGPPGDTLSQFPCSAALPGITAKEA